MRIRPPHHVQNTAAPPSWKQLWREIRCSIWGHTFHVSSGGHYLGMPQSHCWWCGARCKHATKEGAVPEWVVPLG